MLGLVLWLFIGFYGADSDYQADRPIY